MVFLVVEWRSGSKAGYSRWRCSALVERLGSGLRGNLYRSPNKKITAECRGLLAMTTLLVAVQAIQSTAKGR